MNEDGKINGKFPIFNDILAFMWYKMKICPRDTLLNIMKSFYKSEDMTKSRDVLYATVPDNGARRVKHRKMEDMQETPTEDPPVFVAINLNNLPCVDMKNVDGASLVCQQGLMKGELAEVRHEQAAMREQLATILKHLEINGLTGLTPPSTSRPSFAEVVNSDTPGDQRQHVGTPASGDRCLRERDDGDPTQPTTSVNARDDGGARGEERAPRGFIRDADGFLHRAPRHPRSSRPIVTGKKSGTMLKASVRHVRLFVSRLDPSLQVESLQEFVRGLTGSECVIEKLKPKYPSYSSFMITIDKQYEHTLMDPDEWEEGVIVRPFYGKYQRPESNEDSSTNCNSNSRFKDV